MSHFRQAHILTLMSIAAAAFGVSAGAELRTTLIMAGLLAAAAIATVVFEMRAAARPAAAGAAAPVARGSMVQTKRMLMLMMAIGIVVYGGGAGSFATFSAETQNSGSSVASGTLTMSDTVTNPATSTATACFSNNAGTKDNTNDAALGQTNACAQVLKLQNVAPGIVGGYAKIDVANTGSLDASTLNMFAPYVNGTTTSTVTHLVAFTSITLASPGIEGPITAGDSLELDYGGSKITFFAYASYDPTTTGPISVSCAAPPTAQCGVTSATADFPAGSRLLDTSTESTGKPTNCFDQRTGSSDLPVSLTGAKVGTDLNFNGTEVDSTTHWISSNPFCKAALLFVQEQTLIGASTYHYCWYGDGATGTQDATATGQCRMPISVAFAAGQTMSTSATPITYTITAPGSSPSTGLQGNIVSGDTIKISELGIATDSCIANANAYVGDTTISLRNCTAATAFTTAATIVDYSTTFNMNSDQTDTLSNFDTGWPASNLQEMPPLISDGNHAPSSASTTQIELGRYGSAGTVGTGVSHLDPSAPATRTFYVAVFFPTGTATAQNALQGLKTTFSIGWHISQ
jgi:hypothetical protein